MTTYSTHNNSTAAEYVLVGLKRVLIDPHEKPSNILKILRVLDPEELENLDTYYEVTSIFEKQLGKFGNI